MSDELQLDAGRFQVRLARDAADVEAAQRLRYQVFVEELGASASPDAGGREQDEFDPHCEHLLLVDKTASADANIVGAYRMMAGPAAASGIGFYSATEFDLAPLLARRDECLEVGRTCVAKAYRNGPATQLLWAGLAAYVFQRGVGVLFGCASFHGTDPVPLAQPLSLLHHFHLAPPELRAQANSEYRLDMELMRKEQVDRAEAMRLMPSLIKGYLRLGGFTGEGAYRDDNFGVIDVLLVVDVTRVDEQQRKFYRDRIATALTRMAA